MIKHLTTHGNSAALIVDKPVLNLLKIGIDTPLEITTDGRSLIITPMRSAARRKRLRNALKRVGRGRAVSVDRLAEPKTE
jgi:antitoxin component of MazEF toxin-antitoxin module